MVRHALPVDPAAPPESTRFARAFNRVQEVLEELAAAALAEGLARPEADELAHNALGAHLWLRTRAMPTDDDVRRAAGAAMAAANAVTATCSCPQCARARAAAAEVARSAVAGDVVAVPRGPAVLCPHEGTA